MFFLKLRKPTNYLVKLKAPYLEGRLQNTVLKFITSFKLFNYANQRR